MTKYATEFPSKPIVEFRAKKRPDGTIFCTGINIPLLCIVVTPRARKFINYKEFVAIAREHLTKNGTPAGKPQFVTPLHQVMKSGKGTLRFAEV